MESLKNKALKGSLGKLVKAESDRNDWYVAALQHIPPTLNSSLAGGTGVQANWAAAAQQQTYTAAAVSVGGLGK